MDTTKQLKPYHYHPTSPQKWRPAPQPPSPMSKHRAITLGLNRRTLFLCDSLSAHLETPTMPMELSGEISFQRFPFGIPEDFLIYNQVKIYLDINVPLPLC